MGDFAVLRDVDLREAIDGPYTLAYGVQLLVRDGIGFIKHDHVRVRDLKMCSREMLACAVMLICLSGFLSFFGVGWRFGQAGEDVFGIYHADDAVQVGVAAQAVVGPEEGREVAGIGKAGGFEEDIVEASAF